MINILPSIFIFLLIIFLNKFQSKIIFLPKDDISKVQSTNDSNKTLLLNILLLFQVILSYFSISFSLSLVMVFIIGLIDDYINLSVFKRFLSVTIILFIFFIFNQEYLLTEFIINYSFLKLNFYQSLSLSIILILGFIHVMNMSDGRNGLIVSYLILIISYLAFKNDFYLDSLYLLILINYIMIFLLNFFNISYFGNNGILVVSVFFGAILFQLYDEKVLYIREIFILLFIPFYDGLYVTCKRFIKKKSPFLPDKSHLHHLPSKSNWYLSLLIIISLKILLLYVLNRFEISFIYLFFITLISYSLLRFLIRKL